MTKIDLDQAMFETLKLAAKPTKGCSTVTELHPETLAIVREDIYSELSTSRNRVLSLVRAKIPFALTTYFKETPLFIYEGRFLFKEVDLKKNQVIFDTVKDETEVTEEEVKKEFQQLKAFLVGK